MPGIARGDDGHARPRERQLERLACPLQLDAVVAGAALLAATRRHARQVGRVADQDVGAGQRRVRLGRQPLRAGGAEPDDRQRACRPVPSSCGARHEHERHVRHGFLVHLAERRHLLVLRAGALHVDRALADARAPGGVAHLREVAAELDHDGRVRRAARRDASASTGSVPGRIGKHLVAPRQGNAGRGGGRAEGGHSRDDFGAIARREALVQVDVGAVEERVALAQDRRRRDRRRGGPRAWRPSGRRTRSGRPRSRPGGRSPRS